MRVKYYEDEKAFHAELLRASDGRVFELVAQELTEVFNVQWKTKLDGFDQRYWDFKYKGIDLTLHLEHFLGIRIYAEKYQTDTKSVRQVLEEITDHFKIWNPSG